MLLRWGRTYCWSDWGRGGDTERFYWQQGFVKWGHQLPALVVPVRHKCFRQRRHRKKISRIQTIQFNAVIMWKRSIATDYQFSEKRSPSSRSFWHHIWHFQWGVLEAGWIQEVGHLMGHHGVRWSTKSFSEARQGARLTGSGLGNLTSQKLAPSFTQIFKKEK